MEPTLTQLLKSYFDRPDPELVLPIFTALSKAQAYVPAAVGKEGAVQTQGDLVGVKPDTIPGPGGKLLYLAFSAPDQVPDEYGERFTFLHTDFSRFCAAALADPEFGGLVLDPFTARFLIPEEVARALFPSGGGNEA